MNERWQKAFDALIGSIGRSNVPGGTRVSKHAGGRSKSPHYRERRKARRKAARKARQITRKAQGSGRRS